MQVTKKYKAGGFFGNSQAKFGHMAGAEGGFNRKEFRELRRKKRRGESLSGTEGQRLNYMKNVRKDRFKKGLAGAALAGTAAVAAPAALTALKASKAAKLAKAGADVAKAASGASKAKGISGLASKAGSLLKSDGAKKALDLASKISKGTNLPANFGGTQQQPMQSLGVTPFQMPQAGGLMAPGANVGEGVLPIQEFDMPEENFDSEVESVDQGVQDFDQGEENFDDGSGFNLMEALQQFSNFYTGDQGMKVVKEKRFNTGDLLNALETFSAQKKKESNPSAMRRPRNDDQILNYLLEAFADKRRSYEKLDEPFEEKSRAYEKFFENKTLQ